ncbi:hypothetical protein [Micromonospora sp. NPDC023956]|uniref:hypothetical protein n=1 Tax=Micromonospora sp. NPDC023956 TaxID=3155722 RepID=UPI0033D08484
MSVFTSPTFPTDHRLEMRAIDEIYDGLAAGVGLRTMAQRVSVSLANEALFEHYFTREEALAVGRRVVAVALDISRDLAKRAAR